MTLYENCKTTEKVLFIGMIVCALLALAIFIIDKEYITAIWCFSTAVAWFWYSFYYNQSNSFESIAIKAIAANEKNIEILKKTHNHRAELAIFELATQEVVDEDTLEKIRERAKNILETMPEVMYPNVPEDYNSEEKNSEIIE